MIEQTAIDQEDALGVLANVAPVGPLVKALSALTAGPDCCA
jgi:hypothetical protein